MLSRLLFGLMACLAPTVPALAAPALWQVSDEDSSVWLFGSVHMLRADTEWRSSAFEKVMSKVDKVYFETDIGPEAQMLITPLTFELGFNRDGTLLSEIVGPKLTRRVREAAALYNIPMASLLTMKPWMAATTLSMGPLMYSGFDAALGVESVLLAELPRERQGFLETAEEQLGFLAGGTTDEQISMLRATLDTLDVMESDIDEMVAAWAAGQPEELGAVFAEQMGGYDEGMVELLIDERNHNWVEQIEQMLAENESALLVVGAAHLAGDVSVVKLLEDRGFSSRRVQ
ncbi:hypothetical protein SAMN06295905_0829 [Devosia lucknowensis]|uniref:TraB family protein n=1 Tax=Devosia lucknowensis TaxID=1096929 RepID=A0A1Y6ESQ7_9HYPH|nr:TraB/GumN family protein [Devosia lucknowensis]SMQ63532.1 hypothetical protein SAMN06295905_0829 [Devosia lucknowensis]